MKFPLCIVATVFVLALSACSATPTAAPTPTLGAGAKPTSAAAPTTPAGAPTATKPAASPAAQAQAPKYGGTINIATPLDVAYWDDAIEGGPGGFDSILTNEELWRGDWAKGPGGGFGSNATDWNTVNYDIFANKAGDLAQSWKFNVDTTTGKGSIVYELRPGVRFALDPNNQYSKQVGGRELTVDDVIAEIKQETTDPKGYLYRSNPELRNIDVSQTGPLEITIKGNIDQLVTGESRFGDAMRIYAKELIAQSTDWKAHVGTGPFMLTDYVAGSSVTFKKNPNYWMKDPVGPGKGNQLPYVDGVQFFIIPDDSTRMAAFRTAKIDQVSGITWENSDQLAKEFPQMPSADGASYSSGGPAAMYMRTDKPPYNDIRVRQAMLLATDFNAIKQTINGGRGDIITFPYLHLKGYDDLYVGLDSPDLPPAVKDLYTYNPDRAKQLLAQAGYPNGLKTSIMILQSESSYYEAIASMWAKAGIQLELNIKDSGARTQLLNGQGLTDMTSGPGKPPPAIYYTGNVFSGVPGAANNLSFVDDQKIKDTLPKIRALAATDQKAAMQLNRDLTKYALEQVWAIPVPDYPTKTLWWPWVKNYSGEISIGYYNSPLWTQYVWVDQDLKKQMGR